MTCMYQIARGSGGAQRCLQGRRMEEPPLSCSALAPRAPYSCWCAEALQAQAHRWGVRGRSDTRSCQTKISWGQSEQMWRQEGSGFECRLTRDAASSHFRSCRTTSCLVAAAPASSAPSPVPPCRRAACAPAEAPRPPQTLSHPARCRPRPLPRAAPPRAPQPASPRA